MRGWTVAALVATVSVAAVVAGGCSLSRYGEQRQVCTTTSECVLPNPCYTAECSVNGACIFTATDNTAILEQTPGDCRFLACEVTGDQATLVSLPDDDRPPDVECVERHVCSDGELITAQIAENAACRDGHGICEDGACVVLCDELDDPRCDDGNGCTLDVCNVAAGRCENEPRDNKPSDTQVEGDCLLTLCVAGQEVSVHDDVDVEDDAEDCTADSCNQGQVVHTAVGLGSACATTGDPLASVCNGNGQCVQCNGDVECVGFLPGYDDTDCKTPLCSAGVCVLDTEPFGTIAANQSATADCHTVVCDGNGGYSDEIDDNDVHDDGNDCTGDSCLNGVVQHPNDDIDTPCGASGLCDGNGSCGACNDDADCQADTFCRDHGCDTAANPNVCTFTNINQGVALPSGQMSGDCHTVRCNNGAPENQIDDSDVDDDGFECTDDICTAGVPSNPPLAINDPCSEGGGFYCDGSGNCVECNDDNQCSDGDGICESDDCANHVCTVVSHDVTVNAPASCQSPAPDCQVVKCDGMGACGMSVPDDADIVSDGIECTLDTCSGGSEVHDATALNGTLCTQDALFCNGPERCDAGACLASGNPCSGHDVGPACDDSCTEQSGGSCTGPDSGTTSCNDGLYCNGTDTCDGAGTCVHSGNPCSGHNVGPACNDSCTEQSGGSCTGNDDSSTSCDDGQFCTLTDTCDGMGSCVGSGNPCPGHDSPNFCNDSCRSSPGDCNGNDATGTVCDEDGDLTFGTCNNGGNCSD